MAKFTWSTGFLDDINYVFENQYKVRTEHVKIDINAQGWIYTVYIDKISLWWWFNYKRVKESIRLITPRGVTVNIKKFNKRRMSDEQKIQTKSKRKK